MITRYKNKTETIRTVFVLLGVILLLQSCSSTERQLVGTWERFSGVESIVLTLHSDGTFVAQLKNEMLGGILVKQGTASGTWRVKDNRFIGSVTESTTMIVKTGHTWSDEIVRLNKTQLVLRSQSGVEKEFMRNESK